jgi:hypothetical protein
MLARNYTLHAKIVIFGLISYYAQLIHYLISLFDPFL